MTDDDKALVERLREMADEYDSGHHESWPTIDAFNQAADRIEAQAAEIERLREALGWFINDKRFVVQVGGNPNVVPSMIDAATKIYFGETLHVAETCKENGETFT